MDPEEEPWANHGLPVVAGGSAPGERDEPGVVHSAVWEGLRLPLGPSPCGGADRWLSPGTISRPEESGVRIDGQMFYNVATDPVPQQQLTMAIA